MNVYYIVYCMATILQPSNSNYRTNEGLSFWFCPPRDWADSSTVVLEYMEGKWQAARGVLHPPHASVCVIGTEYPIMQHGR
jgi:hypothetical protein